LGRRLQVDEEKLQRLWRSGASAVSISVELGITVDSLNRVRIRLGLPARTPQNRAKPGAKYRDPTSSEIQERAAAIRLSWDDETEKKRRVNKQGQEPYEFPTMRERDISDAIDGNY